MQRYQKELSVLEASQNEILMDFKQIMGTPTEKTPSPTDSKKKFRNKKDNNAICGVLGLASLIVDRDGKDCKVPNDWFQPYPLTYQNPDKFLPTGIPLNSQGLLTASFDVYYSRSN